MTSSCQVRGLGSALKRIGVPSCQVLKISAGDKLASLGRWLR